MIELKVDHLGKMYNLQGNPVGAVPIGNPTLVSRNLDDPAVLKQSLDAAVEGLGYALLLQDIRERQGNSDLSESAFKEAEIYLGNWKPDAYVLGVASCKESDITKLAQSVQFYRII